MLPDLLAMKVLSIENRLQYEYDTLRGGNYRLTGSMLSNDVFVISVQLAHTSNFSL